MSMPSITIARSLGRDLVEIVERVVEWHPPDVREPGLVCQLLEVGLGRPTVPSPMPPRASDVVLQEQALGPPGGEALHARPRVLGVRGLRAAAALPERR